MGGKQESKWSELKNLGVPLRSSRFKGEPQRTLRRAKIKFTSSSNYPYRTPTPTPGLLRTNSRRAPAGSRRGTGMMEQWLEAS